MKHTFFIITCTMLLALLTSCGPSEHERAAALVAESRNKVENGQLNAARILLDSVHATYPKCVAERRLAKALSDSITYIESQRTLQYSDSILATLLPQTDPLLKKFRYEKDDKYEDHGKYVHRLLSTGSNPTRCYLQAYVYDNRITELKSYYFGSGSLSQSSLELSSGDDRILHEGKSHAFEADGYHSILSFEGDYALEFLNYISAHQADRIRVNLLGTTKNGKETNYVYYLNDQEKLALQDTYQLGILMNDIRQLEEAIRIASSRIENYENRQVQ